MNERIKELAVQASEWYEQNVSGKGISGEWETKFAELIVRECMKLNCKELSITNTSILRLLPLYQEHFGVDFGVEE